MTSRAMRSSYAVGRGKRLFDAVVALPMLIATSPLVLVACIAVSATSKGPAIFVQERVGRGRSVFRCYKLRTMTSGTASVPTHEASASAITPVGRFLRRSKIDELPQLWNVLRGDMSLVGPRPCLPGQGELIEARLERDVFVARPGITGLAQVIGIDMSTPLRLAETDRSYLEQASFLGDLAILLRTITRSR